MSHSINKFKCYSKTHKINCHHFHQNNRERKNVTELISFQNPSRISALQKYISQLQEIKKTEKERWISVYFIFVKQIFISMLLKHTHN